MKLTFYRMLMFIGLSLILVGCSNENSEATTEDVNLHVIESVLNETFTGPDEELKKLLEDDNNFTILGGENEEKENQQKPSELDKYLQEKYESKFTNNMLERYVSLYALRYPSAVIDNNYRMKAEDIKVEENESTEGAYKFTTKVQLSREGKEQITKEVKGIAHIYEGQKISNLEILDDGGLMDTLKD